VPVRKKGKERGDLFGGGKRDEEKKKNNRRGAQVGRDGAGVKSSGKPEGEKKGVPEGGAGEKKRGGFGLDLTGGLQSRGKKDGQGSCTQATS